MWCACPGVGDCALLRHLLWSHEADRVTLHSNIQTHKHACINTHARMHAHIFIHSSIYIYTYIHIHRRTYTYPYTQFHFLYPRRHYKNYLCFKINILLTFSFSDLITAVTRDRPTRTLSLTQRKVFPPPLPLPFITTPPTRTRLR